MGFMKPMIQPSKNPHPSLWVWVLVGMGFGGCGFWWVWVLVGVGFGGCGFWWVWVLVGVGQGFPKTPQGYPLQSLDPVIDPGHMSRLDVFIGNDASTESVAISMTENAHLGVRSELEEGGRGDGIDDRHDWSWDRYGSWCAPYWQQWRHLIQVGGGSVSLISWPRDACHMVRETCSALHI